VLGGFFPSVDAWIVRARQRCRHRDVEKLGAPSSRLDLCAQFAGRPVSILERVLMTDLIPRETLLAAWSSLAITAVRIDRIREHADYHD
jgi:hypothetical protein